MASAAVVIVGLAACQGMGGTDADSSTRGEQATRATMRDMAQPAPDWLVGHFVGTNTQNGIRDIQADVDAKGRILGHVGSVTAEGQYIGSNRVLWAHGSESVLERTASGFRMVQARDPDNVTEYQRGK